MCRAVGGTSRRKWTRDKSTTIFVSAAKRKQTQSVALGFQFASVRLCVRTDEKSSAPSPAPDTK
jgi:hypothetical protein